MGQDATSAINFQDTISLPIAQQWCANWISLYISGVLQTLSPGVTPTDTNVLRSFYIPQADITALSTLSEDGVRVYLAVDDTTNPNLPPVLKLILVPVKRGITGEPCSAATPCIDMLASPDGSQSYIFDVTTPCPPQCGQVSDLHVFSNNKFGKG